MELISERDNDVILVGSQSGTISYDMPNISYCCLSEYEFLLGTQPDIVLLCINPFDDINYIIRTINFIESSVDCKVQFLIMFPMDRKKDWLGNFGRLKPIDKEDFNIKCKELEAIIKRKVYLLSEEKNMEQVVEQLIDILSEV